MEFPAVDRGLKLDLCGVGKVSGGCADDRRRDHDHQDRDPALAHKLVSDVDETLGNSQRRLRELNEKLSILAFPDLIPRTRLVRRTADIRAALSEFGGHMILKPVYGYGGREILQGRIDDPNLSTLIELATQDGRRWTVAQEFLPAARDGDKRILLVDDEPGMLNFLHKALAPRAGQVLQAASAEEAEALLQRHRFDLLILDIALPGKSGIALLKEMREQGNPCEVVLITAFADLDTAIEALRAGASDFLLKPFRVTQILNAVRRGLERATLQRENWVLRRALSQRTPPADGLVGRSIAIKGLQSALQRVAAVNSTVLLTGESGTGKELAALALHRNSPRRGGPFVPVNCATMSPEHVEHELFGHAQGVAEGRGPGRDGLFVYAQGGTLFLDEIGDLSLPLQATLLRVLEDRRIRPVGSEQQIPVDVRIVAATNRRLADEVAEGRFRADLYYRLNVLPIHVPPLRERVQDLEALVEALAEDIARRSGLPHKSLSPEALDLLKQQPFDALLQLLVALEVGGTEQQVGENAERLKRIGWCLLGSTLLEIVEPVAGDTPHGRWLAESGPGLHVLGVKSDTLALPELLAFLRARGLPVLLEGVLHGGFEFAVIDAREACAGLLELVQLDAEPLWAELQRLPGVRWINP